MFRRDDDPLSLMRVDPNWMVSALGASGGRAEESLKQMESALRGTGDPAKALSEAGRHMSYMTFSPPKKLRDRLVSVHRKIVELNPKGRGPAEKGILPMLTLLADESLVPFFEGLFDVKIDRDQVSKLRKGYAAAGLGILVSRKESDAALDALLRLVAHPNGDAAAAAARALGMVYGGEPADDYGDPEDEAPAEAAPSAVFEALVRAAGEHSQFLVRFHIRRALLSMGVGVPPDNPGGAYRFKVGLEGLREFSARIVVPSGEDLDRVLWVTLDALGWDYDHLHSFYLSGKLHDRTTEYPQRDDDARCVGTAMSLGQLGLVPKARFVCLYDFGDHHVFRYTCEKVIPKSDAPLHATVIETKGPRPEQYGW